MDQKNNQKNLALMEKKRWKAFGKDGKIKEGARSVRTRWESAS
jgi:hypothetical protein